MIMYAKWVLNRIEITDWLNLVAMYAILHTGNYVFRVKSSRILEYKSSLSIFLISFIMWVTIFLRTPGTDYRANLIPLWSWYQGFLLGNDEIRWQIYFNVLLFVPFGCLLYLSKPRPLSKILLQGFLLSLIIELCQLVFKLGLFEWDDMLHNSLGCLLGGFTSKATERVWNLHRLHKTFGRK